MIFVENRLCLDVIHDISVRLRTGSNPAVNNRFRSNTWKDVIGFKEAFFSFNGFMAFPLFNCASPKLKKKKILDE